jgi:hypothetical protein
LHIVLVANVGTNEFSLRAQRAKLANQFLAGVIAAAGNDEIGAVFREGERGGAADTGQGASDEDNGTGHVSSPV